MPNGRVLGRSMERSMERSTERPVERSRERPLYLSIEMLLGLAFMHHYQFLTIPQFARVSTLSLVPSVVVDVAPD